MGSSSVSSKASDAAASRVELMARIEEDSKHEELYRLEMEKTNVQRKRRELEQARIQKELRMEEAKVTIYKELD